MDPLVFLFGLERLGMKFGLESMTALCAALGNPERAFQSVIVGGTNGKGSVTAITSAALNAAGHRVGRYTSPHLERLEERFVISEREVETSELRIAAAEVQQAVERLVQQGTLSGPPTFFECATAIAFELFRRRGVTVAILEVGLGGRLDATNIVSPIAAAITSIDFDHQAQLGDNLTSIASEKAGIVKPGIPVVCGPLPIEADRVIVETCRAQGARLIRALDRVVVDSRIEGGDTVVSLHSPSHEIRDIRLALRGRHQIANAAVAVCLLEEVGALGFEASEAAIVAALTEVRWPARLERLTWHGADVLLDAAHNPAGARALASYLCEAGWGGPAISTLVFGAMKDKDVAAILAPLLPQFSRVICTTAASPRALAATELAGQARLLSAGGQTIEAIEDPADAVREACQPGSRVVVAGSIFLVGPLRGILR
jgi:dihydrofolate synthase / folylpolyglutamate synthase